MNLTRADGEKNVMLEKIGQFVEKHDARSEGVRALIRFEKRHLSSMTTLREYFADVIPKVKLVFLKLVAR